MNEHIAGYGCGVIINMVSRIFESPPHPFADLQRFDLAAVYLDWSWCQPAQTGKELVRAWIKAYDPEFPIFIADGDSEDVSQWMILQWQKGMRVDDHGWGSFVFVRHGMAIGLIEKVFTRDAAYIQDQVKYFYAKPLVNE